MIQAAPHCCQRGTDAAGERMTDAHGLARQISPPNPPTARCCLPRPSPRKRLGRVGARVPRVPLHSVPYASSQIWSMHSRPWGKRGCSKPCIPDRCPLSGPRSLPPNPPTHTLVRTLWMNFGCVDSAEDKQRDCRRTHALLPSAWNRGSVTVRLRALRGVR